MSINLKTVGKEMIDHRSPPITAHEWLRLSVWGDLYEWSHFVYGGDIYSEKYSISKLESYSNDAFSELLAKYQYFGKCFAVVKYVGASV